MKYPCEHAPNKTRIYERCSQTILTGFWPFFTTYPQWMNPLLSIFHFRYWPKTLKNEVFEAQSLNHSWKDQFDPVLAKQGSGAKD